MATKTPEMAKAIIPNYISYQNRTMGYDFGYKN